MRRVLSLLVGLLALAGVAVASSGGATQAQPRWVITDLGTLGGRWSWAVAINERGQVIANDGWDGTRAFLWNKGRVRSLGTLGGGSSTAVAISESGQVVGWSDAKSGEQHAFLWQNGKMRDLGTMGRESSAAVAINDHSQVVGWTSQDAGEGTRAFIWENGKMRDLGTLGTKAPSQAVAINNRGQVVGIEGWHAEERAFLWEKGKIRDLGTLGGSASIVYAINGRGQIVGRSRNAAQNWHAALWDKGRIRDLGPKSEGYSLVVINERTQIVGSGWPGAFLWQKGRTRSFGDAHTQPMAINGSGQVAGYGSTADCGDTRGMVREPIPRAFVWSNGTMTALPTLPGGKASSPGSPPAVSLFTENAPGTGAGTTNKRGQVVGWSATGKGEYCSNQQMHAVLWTLER